MLPPSTTSPSTPRPKHQILNNKKDAELHAARPTAPANPASSSPPPPSSPAPLPPQIQRLTSQIAILHQQIASTESEVAALHAKLQLRPPSLTSSSPSPVTATPEELADTIVKRHIKLLHDYNEIKDVGMGLMGLIADGKGVRVWEVMGEFGIEAGD